MAIDDVTERMRAETMLKSAKWHAERANLSKSRFLAAASHDLRQPLQTLSLVHEILAKKIKDKKDEEALMLVAKLNETADALLGMLDTLLDINQLEAGGVRPERVDFPINHLLERLRIEFAYHAQAQGLIWQVVPCRLSIRSDPRLLEQMIRNLLSNAVKHTERGKILLGCRRRGDKLRIQVWDTGTGIPGDQLRAIFGEFHQLDNPVREHNVASASVSPSCSVWRIYWATPLMSNPVQARARFSQSRYRSEASNRHCLHDVGRAPCKAQAATQAFCSSKPIRRCARCSIFCLQARGTALPPLRTANKR